MWICETFFTYFHSLCIERSAGSAFLWKDLFVYLLSLLNEEVSLYRQVKRSPQGGSNSRPLVYKTSALATELWRQAIFEAPSITNHLRKNTLNTWHGFYVIDEKLRSIHFQIQSNNKARLVTASNVLMLAPSSSDKRSTLAWISSDTFFIDPTRWLAFCFSYTSPRVAALS